MKRVGIYDIMPIDEYSSTPKYPEVVNSILKAIESGRLHEQKTLPSINDVFIKIGLQLYFFNTLKYFKSFKRVRQSTTGKEQKRLATKKIFGIFSKIGV